MKRFLRWGLFAGVLVAGLGVFVQQQSSLTPTGMSQAANVCALVGALLGVFLMFTLLDRAKGVLAPLVAFVGWRLAFFPCLVMSGHAAAISEWGLRYLGAPPLTVYPILFLGLMIGTAIVVFLVGWVCFAQGNVARVVAIGMLIPTALISFTSVDDFKPLPDYTPWSEAKALPPQDPARNIYADALEEDDVALQRIPLLGAAALTYNLIPPSPWALRVKGTLEGGFLANPKGGSLDRVLEHFQAFSTAHEQLSKDAR